MTYLDLTQLRNAVPFPETEEEKRARKHANWIRCLFHEQPGITTYPEKVDEYGRLIYGGGANYPVPLAKFETVERRNPRLFRLMLTTPFFYNWIKHCRE